MNNALFEERANSLLEYMCKILEAEVVYAQDTAKKIVLFAVRYAPRGAVEYWALYPCDFEGDNWTPQNAFRKLMELEINGEGVTGNAEL